MEFCQALAGPEGRTRGTKALILRWKEQRLVSGHRLVPSAFAYDWGYAEIIFTPMVQMILDGWSVFERDRLCRGSDADKAESAFFGR